MTTTTPSAPAAPDLWHHYGRGRAADRAVPDRMYWAWGQYSGPGAEALGDLTGTRVADLGAGSARQAAHLAVHHPVARVDAVDASAAQHTMATDLYGHLRPRLHMVHAEVIAHLRAQEAAYDVAYSLFGAACFTDPTRLLPAIAHALRPGGRYVMATLAHYLGGAPPAADIRPANVPTKTPDGTPTTMPRWVLDSPVWREALEAAGFTAITMDRLPAAAAGPRTADTLLISAVRAPGGRPVRAAERTVRRS